MKVLRVRHAGQTFYGQLLMEQNAVACLDQGLGLPDPIPLSRLAVLPPLSPSKVVCVRSNSRSRLALAGAKAPDEPVLYLRPPSSVSGSGQDIVLPVSVGRVEPGCELAVVLGRSCRDVAPADVPRMLFGYCCANAVTAVDLLARDGWPGRAAGFDGFVPMGPWIETAVADPSALAMRTLRNGQIIQEGSTADLVFSPLEVVSFASRVMTLLPGDVVLTGTPPCDGGLEAGDEVRVEIDAVGVLINAVRAKAPPSPQTIQ
jgi:2-keto-4-pentenoate hydratase/2-oxohepta-3-ene-1,7-dioic acid hydratase in catechol pathway